VIKGPGRLVKIIALSLLTFSFPIQPEREVAPRERINPKMKRGFQFRIRKLYF
jgi:hypothetical protein